MKDALTPKVKKAAYRVREFVSSALSGQQPLLAIVLGSGLSSFAKRLSSARVLPYGEIPHLPVSTVAGHQGALYAGMVQEVPVVVWAGRTHYYEGRSLEEVTFYVRVTAELGIRHIFLSNAAGGIAEDLTPGDLMVITDHINKMGVNPLRGPSYEFVDLTRAYDPELIQLLVEEASRLNISMKQGVYVATMGPSYETPAEVRAYRFMGGSAVGMSTVPEVIVARAHGLKVAAVSCITNKAAGLAQGGLSHKEVKEVAASVEKSFGDLVEAFVRRLYEEVKHAVG